MDRCKKEMDLGNTLRSILPKPPPNDIRSLCHSYVGPATNVILLQSKRPQSPTTMLSHAEKTSPHSISFTKSQRQTKKKRKDRGEIEYKPRKKATNVDESPDNVMESPEDLDNLKDFISTCSANPDILNTPELVFFKKHLKSIGATLPSSNNFNELLDEPVQASESSPVESPNTLIHSNGQIDESVQATESFSVESTNTLIHKHEIFDEPIQAPDSVSEEPTNIPSEEESDDDPTYFEEYDPELDSIEENRHQCPKCNKSFSRKRNLIIHMRTHTGKNQMKQRSCLECGMVFYRKTGLNKHMVDIHGVKPFQCSYCNEDFKSRGLLKRHMYKHTGTDPCKLCGKVFKDLSNLRYHMKVHSGVKPYQCTQCAMTFICRSARKTHMLVHSDERPNQCNYCGKTFKTAHNLKNHVIIHTDETPYQCNECGKAFKYSNSFKIHMRIHTGEKPYQCSQCGKSFISNASLDAHTKRHHDAVRPFPCNLCEKSFIHKGHLEIHIRIHNGERPFQCVHCGKTFLRKSHLNKHIESHTIEEPESRNSDHMKYYYM